MILDKGRTEPLNVLLLVCIRRRQLRLIEFHSPFYYLGAVVKMGYD